MITDYDSVEEYPGELFTVDDEEYLVLTDSEADEMWNDSIEEYIEDHILPELPEKFRQYFDSEKFKRDCTHDGRGHTLSSYDGNEHELQGGYFAYRVG